MSRSAAAVLVWGASVAWATQTPRALEPVAAARQSAPVAAPAPDLKATLDTYCVTCHNQRLKTGGLSLDGVSVADAPAHAEIWEKVIRKVRGGMMPPAGVPRPSAEARTSLVSWLETSLDRAAQASPNPGRPLAHRLNRAEYANAVRDLLDLRIDPSTMLPADDSSGGFDNNADVLGVSPVLLESYLTAAERVTALALGDPKLPPVGEVFRVRQDASQDKHVEGMPIGTVGGQALDLTLPLDGDYQFEVRLFRTNLGTMRGLEYAQQLEIAVDGERVHVASFGGDKEIAASSENPTTTGNDVDGRFTARVPLKAGPRHITIAFLEKTHALNTRRLQNYVRSSSDTIDFSGYPHIDQIIFTGPFNPTGPGDTPSRRRIFVCRPKDLADEEPCATRILGTLGRRAYRGDFTPDDQKVLLDFFRRGRADGKSFESGIDLALRRLLASPKFVFRVERDPGHRPGGQRLRAQRRGARVAPVLLPLEHRPRRRAADAGGAPPPARAADPRASGAADAGRPEVAVARGQLRGAVAAAAQPAQQAAEFARVSRFRRQPPTRARHRARDVLRLDPARRPERARPDDGRLHLRQRAAGEALRHPQRLRQPFSAHHPERRRPQGVAGQGRHPDGDLARASHLTSAARQVGARERARHAASAAARRGAAVRGGGRGRQAEVGARAHGEPPPQPGVRELPPHD